MERQMNMTKRYDDFFRLTKDAQAAATLVLAEVLQGTTHNVDITFDNGKGHLDVEAKLEAKLGGVYSGRPIQVEHRGY
jgi:hypothetical protein